MNLRRRELGEVAKSENGMNLNFLLTQSSVLTSIHPSSNYVNYSAGAKLMQPKSVGEAAKQAASLQDLTI